MRYVVIRDGKIPQPPRKRPLSPRNRRRLAAKAAHQATQLKRKAT
jgi:hypothetical protein